MALIHVRHEGTRHSFGAQTIGSADREDGMLERPMLQILRKSATTAGCLAVLALLAAFIGSTVARAQVLYGSLSGVVTDTSGASISGAKVEATETAKGLKQEATTDASGLYRFSEILPGTWKIVVSAPGFSSVETDNIIVDPNGVARVDEKLT
ncbi:MAG: carboxypeptidase-like regulatory domain-containing protein, partial [Acidobacteriaceae bacterium]